MARLPDGNVTGGDVVELDLILNHFLQSIDGMTKCSLNRKCAVWVNIAEDRAVERERLVHWGGFGCRVLPCAQARRRATSHTKH